MLLSPFGGGSVLLVEMSSVKAIILRAAEVMNWKPGKPKWKNQSLTRR